MCGGSERVVTSSCTFTRVYSRYYYCGEKGAGRRTQDAGRRTAGLPAIKIGHDL